MTQAREPDDQDRVNRELRAVNRRLDRLEYTQISPQEWNGVLDRIYEEIGSTRSEMRAEFLAVNARLDRMEAATNDRFDSLDAKFNTIMQHLTGEGNRDS